MFKPIVATFGMASCQSSLVYIAWHNLTLVLCWSCMFGRDVRITNSTRRFQNWSHIMIPVIHPDSGCTSRLRSHFLIPVALSDSGHTSRPWSHVMTPVVHPDVGHTSQLRSHFLTLVIHPDSGRTSWLQSYIPTPVDVTTLFIHPNSGRTSRFQSYILTLVAHHDSGPTSRFYASQIDVAPCSCSSSHIHLLSLES
jgi:hypothetical protein